VNTQLRHLAVVAALLIAVLIGATTYWQSWAGGELANRQGNAVQLVAQLQVDRGTIYAANGTRLAWSVPHHKNGLTTYSRKYLPQGAFSQVLGYATAAQTQTGLEQSLNDFLTGSSTTLTNSLSQELNRLGGKTVHGDDVTLTLRPAAQELAEKLLAGRCGAVVAMNPKTGAVYVMASSPTYNPNSILRPGGYAKILKIKGSCGSPEALQNNATAGLYTPGSDFKLVTLSAALDSGKFTPTSPFYDPGYCIDYGTPVKNASSPDSPNVREAFGNVTLSQGLEYSINSVFCNVGMQLGAGPILEYAKRYGFYSPPPLETPPDERLASGLYNKGKLYWPKNFTSVDAGRLGFGQERMQVTPLQMALVAATIANKGVEPKPYLVQKIVGPNGSTVSTTKPQMLGRVITTQTAAEINQMMQLVVQGGTGTAAQIPGVAVAGKTGTAETNVLNYYNAWFVCFAPATNPQVAVAVVVEKQLNGFGGSISAPIAKAILENLLPR
jgi:penicillin-binding protein A